MAAAKASRKATGRKTAGRRPAASRPLVAVLNGPNLNLLGTREPEVYGTTTLRDIEKMVRGSADDLGLRIEFRQSNHEGELVDLIQGARRNAAGIIVNAGAYTHTSVAILDALLAADLPVVEVHLSNLFKREEFRHYSYITPAAHGLICGFGATGYLLALEAMQSILTSKA